MELQKAANHAVLDGLAAYEHRHGRRARLQSRPSGASTDPYSSLEPTEAIAPGNYVHAQVKSVSATSASLQVGRYIASVGASDVSWTGRTLSQLLSAGDLAYVKILSTGSDFKARVRLEENSGVQGALLAIDNASGEVRAMVGGRDFNESKFNRTTQALRQAGSSFKPYLYTAAIDLGATPEDEILDTPATFMTDSGPYSPHNYDEKFEGAITLSHALAESRNIPAVKLAQHLGINTVIGYVRRFGIAERIPAYLPIALGAVELTLLEHTSAFSTFPNDGIRAIPHYIRKVTDYDGRVLEQNYFAVQEVINRRTARVMTSMLREVVLHGTGVAASRLKYPVAGKTGTTNDFADAWFIGFSPSITCGVWVGFDEKRTLGNKETGASAALPIWMNFMTTALPHGGPPRDFLPTPEETNQILVKQSNEVSPRFARRKDSDQKVNSEPVHALVHPASKPNLDQPNVVSQEHQRP